MNSEQPKQRPVYNLFGMSVRSLSGMEFIVCGFHASLVGLLMKWLLSVDGGTVVSAFTMACLVRAGARMTGAWHALVLLGLSVGAGMLAQVSWVGYFGPSI